MTDDKGISPVIGIILMVVVTVGLVVLGATIFLNLEQPENNARASILPEEKPSGVRYEIISLYTAETVTANGVVVGDNAGDSATILPDENGRVTVKGINDSDETILRSGEYTPTNIDTDGDITVSFNGLLRLTSTTKYDWEIVGGRFYPVDTSSYTVDSDGGTQYLRGTDSVRTGVATNSDTVLLLARGSGGDIKASSLLYPDNDNGYGTGSYTYTLGDTGKIGESSEATLIGYNGQEVTFRYDESTASLAKADWELVEENGATITDTPPSNKAQFKSTLKLNDSSERGSFTIRTKDPSTGSEEDRVQVHVIPRTITENTLISESSDTQPDCSIDDSKLDYNNTESGKIEISNDYELQCIGRDSNAPENGYYVLTQNIDLSGTESWNSGKGWNPVKLDGGTLDGRGYNITGLYIDRTTNNGQSGLFGQIYRSSVTNVNVIDAEVYAESGTGSYSTNPSGIVSGTSFNSQIKNVYVEGLVEVKNSNGGGMVGVNRNGATIVSSSANVTVRGTGGQNFIGGIVGFQNEIRDGGIYESYSTGLITSSSDYAVGGIVGRSEDGYDINNDVGSTYSTADVKSTASSNVGGIAGAIEDGNLYDSYATGNLESDGGTVGGVLAKSGFGNTVYDSYWNTQTTGATSSDSGGGDTTGLTTSEMQGASAESNMSGLDFSGTWSTVTDDYPVLQALDKQEQLDRR